MPRRRKGEIGWYPNREPLVVLKQCRCIDMPMGAVHTLGEGRNVWKLGCLEHPQFGEQRISVATYADIIAYQNRPRTLF